MKYCPRCLRTEADIPGCPNEDFPGMNCPEPVEEEPTKTVAISCGPCEFNRIVPVRELLSGSAKNKLPTCRRDQCACVVIPAAEEAAVLTPAPVVAADDPVMPEVKGGAKKSKVKAAPAETPAEDTLAAEPSSPEGDVPGLPTSE